MSDRSASARLVRGIRGFAKKHGGADVCVEYLGQRGARIVLVGEDGAWGDLVAPTYALAEQAARSAEAEADSGVTLREELAGETAARLRTGPYEWRRMAGIQIGGRANT